MKNKQIAQSVNKKTLDLGKLSKSVNDTGMLPNIIAQGSVFKQMSVNERRAFYTSVRRLFGSDHPITKDTIKLYCLYPDTYINCFVSPERKHKQDPDKWHMIVGVLEYALQVHIPASLETFTRQHQELHKQLQVVEKRKKELTADYETYCITTKQ
jgi:hypothetical protein